jgi:hypothetical protein
MIKQILSIIFLVIGLTSFTQGTLRLTAKKNETGNLMDNKIIDSIEVEISYTYVKTQPKKYFTFTASDKNCYLTPGLYNIEVKISSERTIKICEIHIRDSEFTFIDILIEPEISFTKRQLRKRKHFDNYRKNKCV